MALQKAIGCGCYPKTDIVCSKHSKKTHAIKCPAIGSDYKSKNAKHPESCTCDGYHTFDELYEHRIVLFMKLCEMWVQGKPSYDSRNVWSSPFHSDGTCFEGWFILGIGKEKGNQITYHIPMIYWPAVQRFSQVLDKAPEWDGHTPDDVLVRIKELGK